MSVRGLVAIAALVGLSFCGLIASLIHQKIVILVNEGLPKESQFGPMWWYFPKTLRLSREYRRLFPNGKLLWMQRAFGFAMFVCWLCLIWAIGFFHAFLEVRPR